ncbi:DUF4184 family protein [uncultured Microscilla sp.]|uniref:DUF4184 family protein n=1 Tax=uncultured Microscilla sp. TaxID=432653 RepID=UPI002615212A|nr:DUF4184 family protein [uncultured Microscilla sp.]
MPFTFSHPALILPLTYLPKHWVSSSALVIGSLVPDFEYFLRMRINSQYSHTIPGLLWFDLPLGLLLTLVFHQIIRNVLIDNLPFFLKSRVYHCKGFNWWAYMRKRWWVVIISLLIGSASHLLWDSFTHEHAIFVDLFPSLNTPYRILGHLVPAYRLVQHLSTLAGGIVLGWAVWRMPQNFAVKASFNSSFWDVFVLVTLPIFAARLFFRDGYLIGNIVASVIAAGLAGLVITSVVYKQLYKNKKE